MPVMGNKQDLMIHRSGRLSFIANLFRAPSALFALTMVATYVDVCRIGWFGTTTPNGFHFINGHGTFFAIAISCFCLALFFLFPRKPLWRKALMLLLALPSLSIAVDSVISLHYAAGAY